MKYCMAPHGKPCGVHAPGRWRGRAIPALLLAATLALGFSLPRAQGHSGEGLDPDAPVAVAWAGTPVPAYRSALARALPVATVGRDAATPTATAGGQDVAAAFERGLPVALLLVFLLGLALNLTPCVYPMLAVTVSIFGGQSETRSLRVFGRALIYVLGIATMYSVLGVAAALTGGLFGGLLQSRIVLVGISVLFILLALSMFGLYELQIPSVWMSKLGGSRQAGVAGIFLSGLLVGVFAAPCIGPPIIALLALVGQRADPLFGFLVFFVLSLGLGLPYLALGTFSGLLQKLPRSGAWMVWVKKLLGVVLVAVAFFYLSLAFRPALVFILIPLTLVAGGLYLGFLERSACPSRGFAWGKRVVGVGAAVAGVLLFLQGRIPSLEWTDYTAQRLQASGRPAVVYFTADWCIPCLELDRRTFTDEAVIRELNRFDGFKVDLTQFDSPESRAVREQFEVRGVPTMVFVDESGEELSVARLVGFISAEDMRAHLEEVRRQARADAPPMAVATLADEDDEPSRVRLVADVEWIQPGRPFRAGVLFEIRDQWHVYWINPGDSGTEPRIHWEWPEGFEAGPVQWPHPQRFDDPPFATFGHEEQLLLAREVRVPERLESGQTVVLSAQLEWQVCKDICIVQEDRVSLELDVRDEVPPSAWEQAFERARARLPVRDAEWAFAVAADNGAYRLTMTPPEPVDMAAALQAEFFPAQPGFLRSGPYRWQQEGDRAHLTLTPEGPVPAENRLRGVIALPDTLVEQHDVPHAIVVDAPLPAESEQQNP